MTSELVGERIGRLSRTEDIRRVLGQGNRRRLEYVDVAWMVNEAGHLRLGSIVPKFQFAAVARNRLRRRIRELVRRRLAGQLGPLDVVIRARRAAYTASFTALATDLGRWAGGVEGPVG